ncbi:AraC family transcriptional regulator [Paenibacillus antarcticus]|uniref:HTH araC/xylS-type domain-containing protein n=1 Tax=Paenibacillus antarcticus TaxID=253703 RepID=A0A168QBG4_9BACL|nr:AraC family transcriptional regulator [Paenibacillus antarcticus]OAB47598.1 hypothetical protein PBAT_05095 [Paenibacillus antarcticus]
MLTIHFYQSDPFYISRESKSSTSIPVLHYHDAYEILYLISGELYYYIENQSYQIVSGSLLLIRMSDAHKLLNPNGAIFERVTLLFQEEYICELLAGESDFDPLISFRYGSSVVRLRGSEQGFVEAIFDKMIVEQATKLPETNLYLKIILIELLIFIQRKRSSGQHAQLSTDKVHQQISRVVHYINHHFDQRLTLEDISNRFYLSTSHLSRSFKESTGFTFIEYVNNVRVKRACYLLKESKLSVTEIAERVGFESSTHFGRRFKSIVGHAPLKFRQANEGMNRS